MQRRGLSTALGGAAATCTITQYFGGIITFLVLAQLTQPAAACLTLRVSAGVAAYERGDFEKAERKLSKSYRRRGRLSNACTTKNAYYLAKTRIEGWPSPDIGALELLKVARSTDDGTYETKIHLEIDRLIDVLLTASVSTVYNHPDRAIWWTTAIIRVDPKQYRPHVIRAQARQVIGWSREAEYDNRRAWMLYEAHPPEIPDFSIGQAVYDLASQERRHGRTSAALELLREGIDLLESELERIPSPSPRQKAAHDDMRSELEALYKDTAAEVP